MAGNGREPLEEPFYVPGIFRRSRNISDFVEEEYDITQRSERCFEARRDWLTNRRASHEYFMADMRITSFIAAVILHENGTGSTTRLWNCEFAVAPNN